MQAFWSHIAAELEQATGERFDPGRARSAGGGCISQGYRLPGTHSSVFVKLNRASDYDMFAAEAEGLQAMADTETIRVPRPLLWGSHGQHCYLAMEFIEMGGRANPARLGEQLAAMHRHTAGRFGWHRDNTIGSTHQPNPWTDAWVAFWQQHRLGFQLDLAKRNGYGGSLQRTGEHLQERLPALFDPYQPEPSLLHGDLWGGNCSGDHDGHPVIYDPAVYYGDREADLAMTELFGGFGSRFFDAYDQAWPIDPGYRVRKNLYNAYHLLNHLNIFGGGYAGQAEGTMQRVLAELK